MDKFFEMYIELLKQKDYKKIIDLFSGIFILIAPSFSFMFLYKRNLFISIDVFRLITLCLILNIILFYIIFIIQTYKYYLELDIDQNKLINSIKEIDIQLETIEKEVNNLENNCENIRDISDYKQQTKEKISQLLYKREKTIDNATTNYKEIKHRILSKTNEFVFIVVLFMWMLYINDFALSLNFNNDFKIKRLISWIIVLIIVNLISIIKIIIKIKKLKLEKKVTSQIIYLMIIIIFLIYTISKIRFL